MNSDHFIKTATYDCLVGRLLLVKTAKGLLRVSFENENFAEILQDISLKYHTKITDTSSGFSDIFMQLDEYFLENDNIFKLSWIIHFPKASL